MGMGNQCRALPRGDHSLLYFAYTCVRDLFIGGVIYLAKKSIRWWYFTCKKHENVICDGILHVNMFHYFKIPYFTCKFFTKFTYNEYIGPYFLSHVVLRFSPSDLPEGSAKHQVVTYSHAWRSCTVFIMTLGLIEFRATSNTRLRTRDHYPSKTLVGGKGGAGPSSHHTTLEGPTE
jgi:hypothetical protein